MKKEHLIPPEKSKRVIYLDRRGKTKQTRGWSIFFALLGAACLLYCLCIGLFMGYGSRFFLIWAVAGAMLCGLAGLFWGTLPSRLPVWLKRSLLTVVILVCGIFLVIEGMIVARFWAKPQPGADYVIVLGAQWKQNGPSYVLQKRLDKAIEYLNDNPLTMVIVSGGQGSNEPVSEAEGMQSYLTAAGIAPERILLEAQSTNTYENLVFCSELLDAANDRVVIVTNNFHVFRATAIASRQGYGRVEGLAAGSYPGMLPNNLLREFFGVVKDFLVGNL